MVFACNILLSTPSFLGRKIAVEGRGRDGGHIALLPLWLKGERPWWGFSSRKTEEILLPSSPLLDKISSSSLEGKEGLASSCVGCPGEEVLLQHHLLNLANFKSTYTSFQQFHIWKIPFQICWDKGTKIQEQECLLQHCWRELNCGQILNVHQWTRPNLWSIRMTGDQPADHPYLSLSWQLAQAFHSPLYHYIYLVIVYFGSQALDYNFPPKEVPCML